jgi:hypothetical protein
MRIGKPPYSKNKCTMKVEKLGLYIKDVRPPAACRLDDAAHLSPQLDFGKAF